MRRESIWKNRTSVNAARTGIRAYHKRVFLNLERSEKSLSYET